MKLVEKISVPTLLCVFILAYTTYAFSEFGFGDSTGAPLLKKANSTYSSCASTGCHLGNKLNDSRGTADIVSNIPLTGWEPNKTYRITAKINFPGKEVFGFQLIVWGDKDSVSIGKLSKEKSDSCALSNNNIYDAKGDSIGINQYATHTKNCIYSSKNGQPVGQNEWSFNWTAPEIKNQKAIIYGVFVAANDNGTQSGDFVFRLSRNADSSSIPSLTSLDEFNKEKITFQLYPNPADDFIVIQTKNMLKKGVNATIYTNNGAAVRQEQFTEPKFTMDIRTLTPGTYILAIGVNITLETKIFIKK